MGNCCNEDYNTVIPCYDDYESLLPMHDSSWQFHSYVITALICARLPVMVISSDASVSAVPLVFSCNQVTQAKRDVQNAPEETVESEQLM